MHSIEALAAQYREEVEISDTDPAKKRHIMQVLGVEVILLVVQQTEFAG